MKVTIREKVLHQAVDVGVMGMGDVNTEVPGKASRFLKRCGQAADVVMRFVHSEIMEPQLLQTKGRAESARAGTYDDDAHGGNENSKRLQAPAFSWDRAAMT